MPATFVRLETIAGPPIDDAFDDAVRVSRILKVNVMVEINGVDVFAMPGDDPKLLRDNWLKALRQNAKFVSANVIPHPAA